jgi:prepilin-type processing-associated H-X9-DG protein
MKQRLRHFRGFTVWELLVVILIVFVLTTIFFPVPPNNRTKARQSSCASNLKQIGIAFLAYAQDNDDKFPPVTGVVKLSDGKTYERQWGPATSVLISGTQTLVPGILNEYVGGKQIFQCPEVPKPNSGLNYIYNDLAANEPTHDMPGAGNSILTADGENYLRNVGHARSQSNEGVEAVFRLAEGKAPALLLGGAVGDAVTRHRDGANYGFVDGHVKWMKPESVFFPPRTSDSSSHREAKTGTLLGPDPAGAKESDRSFQGRFYKATFHVR